MKSLVLQVTDILCSEETSWAKGIRICIKAQKSPLYVDGARAIST